MVKWYRPVAKITLFSFSFFIKIDKGYQLYFHQKYIIKVCLLREAVKDGGPGVFFFPVRIIRVNLKYKNTIIYS